MAAISVRFLQKLARHGGRIAARRLARGPRRPGWSWRYELLQDWLRESFAAGESRPLEVQRERMDRLGQARPRRVQTTPTEGGVWVVPDKGHDDRVVIYLHGGGYCIGSSTSHMPLVARLAERARARVLALDYRLAPEHPCPAAIEDVLAAWSRVTAETSPDRVVVAGDSAGGGLTVSALQAIRDAGGPVPAAGVTLSPWVALDRRPPTADADFITPESLAARSADYAGALSLRDPRVSPVYGDFTGLPPLGVWVGGAELLLDDALALVQEARAAGVEVELTVEPDEVHVYPFMYPASPAAGRALDEIADYVRRHT